MHCFVWPSGGNSSRPPGNPRKVNRRTGPHPMVLSFFVLRVGGVSLCFCVPQWCPQVPHLPCFGPFSVLGVWGFLCFADLDVISLKYGKGTVPPIQDPSQWTGERVRGCGRTHWTWPRSWFGGPGERGNKAHRALLLESVFFLTFRNGNMAPKARRPVLVSF